MKCLALTILLGSLCACSPSNQSAKIEKEELTNVVSVTEYPGGRIPSYCLATIKHDGHLWVVNGKTENDFKHHPDCPCGKK